MTISLKSSADGLSGVIQTNSNDIIKFDQSGIIQGAPLSFRNKLINGNFDMWQRGTSFVNPASVYTADRWNAAGTNTTFSRVAAYTGYGQYALAITATNAANSCAVAQPIESTTTSTLIGKTITLSFYYSASVNEPTNSLSFLVQRNSTQDTNAGGTWSALSTTTLLSPTTTIQRATVSVAVPNDGTSLGIRPYITTSNITNGSYVYIWGVQLEEGPLATAFEIRPIGLELALCQRYYIAGSSSTLAACYATNTWLAPFLSFPVEMRTAPTMTHTATAPAALIGTWTPQSNAKGFRSVFVVAGVQNTIIYLDCTYTANAEL